MDAILATYGFDAAPADANARATAIALEQTIEAPIELAVDPFVREHVAGKVLSVSPVPEREGRWRAEIAYPADLAAGPLCQLLNLLFGNVSLLPAVRLEELWLPPLLVERAPGPRYGVPGLRTLTGVGGRPLLATALKPRGLPIDELAARAEAFARGGGDLVKDDQNLVDPDFAAFRARVTACREAVDRANDATGRRCLYLANLSCPVEETDRRLEWLVRSGVDGVLVAPLLSGIDTVRRISTTWPLAVMAHPALTGGLLRAGDGGIAPGILLGTVFRLAGADVSVFPSPGGRFAFTEEDVAGIAGLCRRRLDHCRESWPAPSGGMDFHHVPQLARLYGEDAVWLVGAALHLHPGGLEEGAQEMLDRMREHFPERLFAPEPDPDRPPRAGADADPDRGGRRLAFTPDFRWKGVEPGEYKSGGRLPFRDVARHELLRGREAGAAFDLRYFEVGPGGHTSRERHEHAHGIVAARGKGVLTVGETRHEVRPLDVAWVPPGAVHRLENESATEPFGFFCIVDRDRDRPRAP